MPETDTRVKEITDAIEAVNKKQFEEWEPLIQKAVAAGEAHADLDAKSEKANAERAKLLADLDKLDKQQQAEKDAFNKRIDELEKRLGEGDGGAESYKSLGKQFIEKLSDDELKNINATERIAPMKLELNPHWLLGKSISTAGASAGPVADSLRLPGVITQPEPALVVQAMLSTRTIDRLSVDYVRELVFTDNTATVAETTDDTSLVAKPKGDITFEVITDVMNTIAQWIPASRRSLRYATRTDLLNYVDGRLRDRVLLELEDQVLTGDGTGSNLSGIIPNATLYTGGFGQLQGANPTEVDTLRRAITQLQLANYFPTGIILHPLDWEVIDLNKDTQLRYILAGSPQGVNSRTLWGVPVMVSNRMISTEFLIGDFRATTLEIMIGIALNVRMAEEHAEFFTANMVAILAEMDALLAFYRPEAIINGELVLAS